MTFAVHVQGGTGAGSKRPLKERPQSWTCRCVGAGDAWTHPGYRTVCPDCGTRRPT